MRFRVVFCVMSEVKLLCFYFLRLFFCNEFTVMHALYCTCVYILYIHVCVLFLMCVVVDTASNSESSFSSSPCNEPEYQFKIPKEADDAKRNQFQGLTKIFDRACVACILVILDIYRFCDVFYDLI